MRGAPDYNPGGTYVRGRCVNLSKAPLSECIASELQAIGLAPQQKQAFLIHLRYSPQQAP